MAGVPGRGRVGGPAAGAVATLGHQGQEGVKAARVEVAAPVGLHVGQGPVGRPGRPVGAVGGERVPHVGHGHDPRGQRDLLPGDPVGVAAPVVALVVLADHGEGVAQRRGPPDDVLADDRVLLDPGPLVVGEGAWLVEHVVGDADLADVMEVGTLGQGAQGRRPQPQPQADADRQLGHPRRVAVGVGVAGLDGADQGPQGLGVAAADVGHRVAGEHSLEHVLEGAAAPVAGDHGEDGGGEPGQQEGVVVPPGEVPGPADLKRQQGPGAEQAGHHQRQLHAVEPEPPAAPVDPAKGDQHQGRPQDQGHAGAGLGGKGPATDPGGRPERDRHQGHGQGQAAGGQRPRRPAPAPARPPRPGRPRTWRWPAPAGAPPTGLAAGPRSPG